MQDVNSVKSASMIPVLTFESALLEVVLVFDIRSKNHATLFREIYDTLVI